MAAKIKHYIGVKRWGEKMYTHSIEKRSYDHNHGGKKRVLELDGVVLHILIPLEIDSDAAMAKVNEDASQWVKLLKK